MKKIVLTLSLFGLLQGCGEGVPSMDQWKAELMEADRVFAETVGQEGLSAWGSFFSPDASVIQEGVGEIQGVEAVQASMDAAAGAVTSFTWAPERAEVSLAGDMGYTVGRFRTRAMTPDGVEMETTGMYVSIWRRQGDGSWKVEMDLGNPITPPTPVNQDGSPSGNLDQRP